MASQSCIKSSLLSRFQRNSLTSLQMLSTICDPSSIPGEAWPPEPVRDIIEMCQSRDLEKGFQIGLYNRRGVTVRLPTDGGQQERCAGLRLRLAADACGVGTDRRGLRARRRARRPGRRAEGLDVGDGHT